MDAPSHILEQTLVLRSQLGDEAAFEQLLNLHRVRLLSFTRRLMQAPAEAVEDMNQEIWLAIYRALPSLRDVSRFQPWAFCIARPKVYREFRKRKVPTQPLLESGPEPAGESVREAVLQREEIDSALAALSPAHREVLVLRYFEDLSYEEIAHVIGGSLGTVRSRLHYAKQAVKMAWEGTPK